MRMEEKAIRFRIIFGQMAMLLLLLFLRCFVLLGCGLRRRSDGSRIASSSV